MNDVLADRIKEGKVSTKPYVSQLRDRHATFSDGSQMEDIDVVIYATGYKLQWEFLPNSILDGKNASHPIILLIAS